MLLSDLTGRPLPQLIAHGEVSVDAVRLERLLERRYAGEPLQYIRGRADFYTREFMVDDRVLIPRPETEFVVETAIAIAPRNGRVIDIGTGSGCIAISIERERPDLAVTAVDLSPGALAVASINRRNLRSHVRLAASDVLTSIGGEYDLIVSNPPYIPERDLAGLQIEVRDHEPRSALTPGARGTEIIERILDESRERLRRGGHLVFEFGFGQEAIVRDLASRKCYDVVEVVCDLAAIPRVIVLSAHGW